MALSLLSVLGPGHPMLQREENDSHVKLDLGRRKQKNPRPISSSSEQEEGEVRFEEEGASPTRDLSDMVKVEIHNGLEESEPERRQTPVSPRGAQLFPPMEDLMRKCNLIPFGEVTIQNHPNTPPIPMTIPMTYLFPISKDAATGEAKYKMLVPRNGGEMAMGFPAMIPFPSPPLLPHMVPPPNFRPEDIPVEQMKKAKSVAKKQKSQELEKPVNLLKVEVREERSASPLDLTHRSPNSTHSETEDERVRSPKKEQPVEAKSPEQKLGPEIEAQLNFLKVKQMEFLKQAAESASVNRCNECNINFSKYQNYLAHKKYYCSGLKQGQAQDSDEDSSNSSAAKPKTSPALPSSTSPPFSAASPAATNKALFSREFFLNQKSLLEGPGPGPKLPPGLLLAPGALPPPPPQSSSHFVCQGCGIKFKSISNLQAHQSRYCAGIKNPEEAPVVGPSLEALLKSGLAQMPMAGMSAADMMSFLSAQQALKAEAGAAEPERPAARSPSRVVEASTGENGEDFCCILCGYKESSVDKLKDHINMHFIGQVKKRKSENEGIAAEETADKENKQEPVVKKIKVEGKLVDEGAPGEKESEGRDPLATSDSPPAPSLTCSNCNISFVNPSTYSAHVQFYCKKKKEN